MIELAVMSFKTESGQRTALRFFSSACRSAALRFSSSDLLALRFHTIATNTVFAAFCSRRKLIWTSKSALLFRSSLSYCSALMSLAMFR